MAALSGGRGSRANRDRLSQMFCRHASWLKPDGGLKEMSCRVALLKLQRSGLIELPLPRRTWRARAPIPRTPEGEPADETTLDAGAVDIHLELVGPKNRALWNELIDRYHYLGFCRTGGAQLRYFVHAGGKVVALLGFCAAAWRVASRDAFIGWSADERKNQLYRVVDNYRFLILPWIKARNLASRILSAVARRLPDDWQERYHYRPVLLESFVESGRFLGSCYKASNWLCVGDGRPGQVGPGSQISKADQDRLALPPGTPVQGGLMPVKPPRRIKLTKKELKALQGRIKERRLEENDWQIVESLAETVECLNQALDEKNTSLGRLCKYLLGAPTETAKISSSPVPGPQSINPPQNPGDMAATRRLPIRGATGWSWIIPRFTRVISAGVCPGQSL